MRIQNFNFETKKNRSRISADLTWEDCDRSPLNLFFETNEEYADALSDTMEPFLVGCILPAMHHGEQRISVEGNVCPDLEQNLIIAMELIRHWYYEPAHHTVAIESTGRSIPKLLSKNQEAGFFLSGGIDCLATLHANRANYPMGHPAAIKYGLLIYGQNIESDVRVEIFQKAFDDLRAVAGESDVALIPVYTNIRLVDDSSFMFSINHGAILGAVAHAFSNCLIRVYISASDSIPTLSLVDHYNFKPHGSHPLLDPLFSSHNMTIKHDGIAQSRLDKVEMLSHWDSALQQIRVCGPNWPGENCCNCEKCVRTMLELLAAGVLHKTRAFSIKDVSAEMILRLNIKKPEFGYTVDDDYLELIRPLERMGRQDLIDAILSMIDRSHYPAKSLKQKFRRFDAKYLDNSLSRIKKKISDRRNGR